MHGITRKAVSALAVLSIVSLAVVASAFARPDGGNAIARTAAGCDDPKIGFMGPITGDAAFIGKEQLGFSKFAVKRLGRGQVTLVEGDTQLDPAQASTVGQRFASDGDILAVVGPAGSQEVEAVGPVFQGEGLAFISGSATATALTDGRFETFSRVVPNDDAQAPTAAEYISEDLDADTVVVIDDQTSYSRPLADGVQANLEDAGVTVTRQSVNQRQTDFSSLVSRVPDDADVVFLPWQIAANAQIFGQQLKEQGKDAVIFGSDGLFSPSDFTIDGSFVSSFAPDITNIEESTELAEAYQAEYGDFGTFGPPTYAATEVLLTAMQSVCEDGGELTREAVADAVGETTIDESILGGSLSFTDSGDPEGAEFYIFRIGGGEYELVTE
jgi:branched-chain amino acid transport system substrate-binding protein